MKWSRLIVVEGRIQGEEVVVGDVVGSVDIVVL